MLARITVREDDVDISDSDDDDESEFKGYIYIYIYVAVVPLLKKYPVHVAPFLLNELG